jgi:hypothetical protein
MKFDVVITNPPYQDSSHNEKKNTLWRKFIELSQNYTKVGGYSSLLIPSSWMGSKKLLNEFFLDKDIIYINKDECKRHFPGVGSNFSYYVINHIPYRGITEIKNKQIDGTILDSTIDIRDVIFDCFPRDLTADAISIIQKVLSPNRPKLGIINTTTHHNVHKKRWRKKQDAEFIYPVQNTPNLLYYYNYPHLHQNMPKIKIFTTTYYNSLILSNDGTTQSGCYYLIPTDLYNSTDIVVHNMKNKVFDYINECFRYSNWNSVNLLRALPKIPFDKIMSNEDFYEYFEFTIDEIKHIEKSI